MVLDSESSDSNVPISSTGVRRGHVAPESSASHVPISSTGVRRGQVAPESSDSDSQVPVSSTGVKRGRAAPDSGAPAGKRRKKTSRSPYAGWSGTGQASGDQGSLPLRIVTQVRTVLDYVKGTGHRPRNWMRSFPLIHGGDSGQGESILLIVPPETKAKASHKAQPQPEPESEGED